MSDSDSIDQDQLQNDDYKYISQSDSNSDIIDKSDNESDSYENIQNLGQDKKDYYQQDDETSGDSDQEAADKAEAEKLFKVQQQKLNEEDFELLDDGEKQQDKNKFLVDDDDDDEDNEDGIEEEKTKNQELLEEEKEQLLKDDCEEAKILLAEAKQSLENISENEIFIENPDLINKNHQIQKIFTKNFPKISKDLNMSYVLCIYYFFLLKKSGESVKTHPVIKTLTKLKEQIKKISEINSGFQMEMNSVFKKLADQGALEDQTDKKKLKQQQKAKKNQKQQQNQPKNNIKNKKGQQQQKTQKKSDLLLESDEEDRRINKGINQFDDEDFDDDTLGEENDWDGGDSDDMDLDNIQLGGGGKKAKKEQNQNVLQLSQPSKKIKKGKKQNKNDEPAPEDLYYEMIKNKQIEKKLAKQEEKDQRKAEQEKLLEQQFTLKEVKENAPRKINRQIFANKGLVRNRNNDISKVKLRKKYKKAEHVLVTKGNKSRRRVAKEVNYTGEKNYIKSGIIRGTKLG